MMERLFSGKVVFVIGVGWGIGCEIVFCFVQDGVSLIVYYVSSSVGVEQMVVDIVVLGGFVVLYQVDILKCVEVVVFFDVID